MTSITRALRLVVLAALLTIPLPVRAVEIVVDGIRYDILFLTGNDTIPDNLALVQSQPWYTGGLLVADRVPAQTFAQAYLDQAGTAPFNVNPDGGLNPRDELHFIYYDEPTLVGSASIDDEGWFSGSISTGFLIGSSTPYFHYAYVSGAPVPVAVPEIDGNALAKALFVLLAFGLWLRTRRERQAG